MRKGVRAILSIGDIEICGEATNGIEAISKAVQLKPDLIILDLTMPVMGGFAAALELSRVLPNVPILFYSIHEGAQLIKEAQRIGVRGFVSKSRISDSLLEAVNVVAVQKGTYFPDTADISALYG